MAFMANTPTFGFHPEHIRPAEADEIDRIALVAAAGFYNSPANAYERPQRDIWPQDTFQSYRYQLLTCLWDPKRILIVAQDKYESAEDEELYPALHATYGGGKWPEKVSFSYHS
jgi:hypothetical protein